MAGLEGLECFALGWHEGRWSIDRLPGDLGLVSVTFPAQGSVLGVSLLKSKGIALADRLDGKQLRRPVLLHECGHHILGISSWTALCHSGWRPDLPAKDELMAWAAAGRLSVSADQLRKLQRGHVSVDELAEDNGVPGALIVLGAAVYAAARGDRSRLGPALAAWCLEMQRLVRLL